MTEPIVADGVLIGDPAPGEVAQLRASHCAQCGRWEFPALTYCPACGADPAEQALSSTARVQLVSAVLHQPPGALIDAPYAVVLAEFPEGLGIMGVVPDVGYEQIEVGDTVTAVAARIGETTGYQFRLDRLS